MDSDQALHRGCDEPWVSITRISSGPCDLGNVQSPLFAGAPGLMPDECHLVETEEAWILGLGHEEALKRALPPP